MRRIAVEQPIDDAGPARVGEKLALVANQPARWREETQAQPAPTGGLHLDQFGLALRQLAHDDARMLLIEVDYDFLDGFEQRPAGIALEQHLGARDGALEALAPHGLDEAAELNLAPAGDLHRIAPVRSGNA